MSSNKHSGGRGIFSPVCGRCGCVLMNLGYSFPDPQDIDYIVKVMGSEVKITCNIFRKCTESIPIDSLPLTTVELTSVLSLLFAICWSLPLL